MCRRIKGCQDSPTPSHRRNLGNHEIEAGNGPLGYLSYQTRYRLPWNASADFSGNWYSFQVGSVLFISLDNNDVVFQNDGGVYAGTTTGPYLLGYSGGQQLQWLERTLQRANFDPTVDWIIAYFHQPAMSTSTTGSGSDMGIRQTWLPLFYEYGVDLVDPGRFPGDRTSITMTYYHTPAATTSDLNPAPIVYDTFTAVRPRRDGFLGRRAGVGQKVHA
jgi:hypothetical protein